MCSYKLVITKLTSYVPQFLARSSLLPHVMPRQFTRLSFGSLTNIQRVPKRQCPVSLVSIPLASQPVCSSEKFRFRTTVFLDFTLYIFSIILRSGFTSIISI